MRADRMDDAMAEKLLAELLEGAPRSAAALSMDMDEGSALLAAPGIDEGIAPIAVGVGEQATA